MIEKIPSSEKNVLGFALKGKIVDADYQQLISKLRTITAKEESICILFELNDLQSISPKASLDDIELALKFKNNIRKFAIVGGEKWEKELAKLYKIFIGTEVKYFPSDNTSEAQEWFKK